MGVLDDLPVYDPRVRNATPKHQMKPACITKAEKRQSKEDKGKAFRDAVWARDKGRCRATGVKLHRSARLGANTEADLKNLGDVDHSFPRSTHPEHLYSVEFGILLQSWLNLQRKVSCVDMPEFKVFDYEAVTPGDDDRGKLQKFTWRHPKTGRITKTRIG